MTPDTAEVLDEARVLIEQRLKELDEEKARLQRALSDITGGKAGRRRPGRPRGSGAGRKRGRRRNTRSDQAVKLVQENPGISASEIAKQLKIKPNYMYRVMGELQKEGRVRKRGRAYHPA
jgi:predicted HTH transcriptional regulator